MPSTCFLALRRFSLALFLLLSAAAAWPQTASLVVDVNPSTGFDDPEAPEDLVSVGDKLFFVAQGELWVSDGSGSGTELLADVCRGACGSFPRVAGSTPTLLLCVAEPAAAD